MALYSFAYTSIPIPPSDPFPQGQVANRPLLVERLREPVAGGVLTCLVLLDSGADHCVFPASFLTVLGLDPLNLKMQMTSGVGSAANVTYYADISVEIPIEPRLGLAANVRAGFTPALDAQGLGLLGQTGIFDRFRVTFDHSAGLFHIEA